MQTNSKAATKVWQKWLSIPYQVCVTAITIFVLFADDINVLCFGP